MDDMANTSTYLLRAILQLIEKCQTMDELRTAVAEIMKEDK